MDSFLFMYAATPVLVPTMFDSPSGPNLDLFCVEQLGPAPFFENSAKQNFDAKHLKKDWIGSGEIFGSLHLFEKKFPFSPILEAGEIF